MCKKGEFFSAAKLQVTPCQMNQKHWKSQPTISDFQI